jgi:hypothetical protein
MHVTASPERRGKIGLPDELSEIDDYHGLGRSFGKLPQEQFVLVDIFRMVHGKAQSAGFLIHRSTLEEKFSPHGARRKGNDF